MSFNRHVQIRLFRPVDPGSTTTLSHEGRDIFHVTISTVRMEGLRLSSDIRTSFRIKTSSGAWEGSVSCMNLSESTIEFLNGGFNGLRGGIIEIDAGYEDNHDLVWRGGVSDIINSRKKTDVVTEFVLSSFLPVFRDGIVSISYQNTGKYDGMNIVRDTLSSKGVEYVVVLDEKDIWRSDFATRVFSGSVIDFMRVNIPSILRLDYVKRYKSDDQHRLTNEFVTVPKLTKAAYTIGSSGVVFIHWEDSPPEKHILSIDEDSGLLESPKIHTKGKKRVTKAKILFSPYIKRGGMIRLTSRLNPASSGDYRVSSLKMNGTNGTGGHFVNMELKKVSDGNA